MPKQYDLIAIGSGTAASVAASRCRAAGWKIAVIDHLPLGGTCALRGCDPKKVLVGVAEAVDAARRLRGKGIGGGEPVVDWRALMAFKRGFTDPVPEMKEQSFERSGIDVYHGFGRIADANTIIVDHGDGLVPLDREGLVLEPKGTVGQRAEPVSEVLVDPPGSVRREDEEQ